MNLGLGLSEEEQVRWAAQAKSATAGLEELDEEAFAVAGAGARTAAAAAGGGGSVAGWLEGWHWYPADPAAAIEIALAHADSGSGSRARYGLQGGLKRATPAEDLRVTPYVSTGSTSQFSSDADTGSGVGSVFGVDKGVADDVGQDRRDGDSGGVNDSGIDDDSGRGDSGDRKSTRRARGGARARARARALRRDNLLRNVQLMERQTLLNPSPSKGQA